MRLTRVNRKLGRVDYRTYSSVVMAIGDGSLCNLPVMQPVNGFSYMYRV